MRILNSIWEGWKKFGFFLGNAISFVVLSVFYFSVFALFAIPFRIFSKPFSRVSSKSNFRDKKPSELSLKSFSNEF